MAVLWQKKQAGTLYEVRSAGNSRRLYTDGVFHSQYNPTKPLTGGVWDLLMLPAFFYPAGAIQRVLVLGVGGGAVNKLLHRFVQPHYQIGIELNPLHLYVAKRFFKVERKIMLQQADAIQWLRNYRGPGFDMIIDDLFGEQDGEPVRAVDFNRQWMTLLLNNLNSHGVLAANFVSNKEFKQCAYFSAAGIQKKVKSAFRLTRPLEENVVAAFVKQNASSKILRNNIATTPELRPLLKHSRQRITLRAIQPA